MGWRQYRKDLDKLAAARRQRATDRKDADRAAAFTSFGERCRWLVQVEANPKVYVTGKPEAVLPRLDGFASDVAGIAPLATALLERISNANTVHAQEALTAFGLPLSHPPSPQHLLDIQHATNAFAESARSLLLTWPVSGKDDREERAVEVAEAARKLLDAASA